LPAGPCGRPDADAAEAARRKLAGETGFAAGRWDVLVDVCPNPGRSVRIYLARAVHPIGAGSDAELPISWMPLDEAVGRVFDGEITDGRAVAGLLAAGQAATAQFRGLRPVTDQVRPTDRRDHGRGLGGDEHADSHRPRR
jgi:ADP-ribose pyrophosphatase